MIRLAAVALLGFALPVFASSFSGRVVGVLDGDTIDVLTAEKVLIRVRLCQIDAPEKRQPFGNVSKQSLSDLVYGMDAVIEDEGKDRYGRTIGCITANHVDVIREQLRRGMAWVFTRYAKDADLAGIEAEARSARRGLWADPAPTPPWQFRHPKKPTENE